MSVSSIWLKVQFKSNISLLIFYVVDLSIVESEKLCYAIIVFMAIKGEIVPSRWAPVAHASNPNSLGS
jgi:hypothetical protein